MKSTPYDCSAKGAGPLLITTAMRFKWGINNPMKGSILRSFGHAENLFLSCLYKNTFFHTYTVFLSWASPNYITYHRWIPSSAFKWVKPQLVWNMQITFSLMENSAVANWLLLWYSRSCYLPSTDSPGVVKHHRHATATSSNETWRKKG